MASLVSTNTLVATSTVKFYTGITSTTNDLLIESLVPVVLDDIVNYTHNYFLQSTRFHYDDRISFSTTGSIICSNTEIDLTDWLQIGSIFHVSYSLYNDGYFSCSTATSNINSNYVNVNETVNAETTSTGKWIMLIRTEYPKDLPLIASRMIKHILITQNAENIQSESLGDHSITYVDIGTNSYPVTIANSLNKYRKARFY